MGGKEGIFRSHDISESHLIVAILFLSYVLSPKPNNIIIYYCPYGTLTKSLHMKENWPTCLIQQSIQP